MIKIICMISALSTFVVPAKAWGETTGALRASFVVDGRDDGSVTPGLPSLWSLTYLNEDGTAHRKFMKMHDKLMHMIVVRDDLSRFAHVHPYLNAETGTFSMTVNEGVDDPDNFAMSRVVPVPGRYFVFTESMPMPVNDQMPMLMDRFEIFARDSGGVASMVSEPKPVEEIILTPMKPLRDQEVPAGVKYFNENGAEGQIGDLYQVDFSYVNQEYCGRWLPKFFFKVSIKSVSGTYVPVNDFEKWLNMGGHSIMISSKGSELPEKKFYHLHAFLPMAEPGRFTFPYDHHLPPLEEGVYKIWGQFKRSSQVFTFPFLFRYVTPDFPDSSKC